MAFEAQVRKHLFQPAVFIFNTYGYHRVWALLRRQSETDDMAVINAKRVYRIMRQNALLLERNRQYRPRNGRIQGKRPLEKVTSGGALTASGSAVIMA